MNTRWLMTVDKDGYVTTEHRSTIDQNSPAFDEYVASGVARLELSLKYAI